VRGRTRLEAESPYRASVVHQECELLVERHVAKMAANSQCWREIDDDVCGKFELARLLKLSDAVVATSFPRRIWLRGPFCSDCTFSLGSLAITQAFVYMVYQLVVMENVAILVVWSSCFYAGFTSVTHNKNDDDVVCGNFWTGTVGKLNVVVVATNFHRRVRLRGPFCSDCTVSLGSSAIA
jgi:hypothetical protein